VTPAVVPPAQVTPPAVAPVAVAGVAGAKHTQAAPAKPRTGVAGTKHTQAAPAAAAVAPVHVTHGGGTLPFTGADLGIFVAAGLGLVALGFLLHRAGRTQEHRS